MSTQRGQSIHYQCMCDCQQTGCPGHVIVAVYHHTSDVLSFEIDGEMQEPIDPQRFEAMVRAYDALGKEKRT